MNVLVVAAHPDDEVLGAGGMMQRHVAQRDQVFVLILGEGITSRYTNRAQTPKNEVRKLRTCSEKALKLLQVTKGFYRNFPDNRFDSVDLLDIIKEIESVKKQVGAQIVYTHHAGDLNIDHQITFQAVLTATRPVKTETVKQILSFEVPSSTEWNISQHNNGFFPNVYFDISNYLNKKIKALQLYSSEVKPPDHPRSSHGLKTLATWRGLQAGKKAAEAFELVRYIS